MLLLSRPHLLNVSELSNQHSLLETKYFEHTSQCVCVGGAHFLFKLPQQVIYCTDTGVSMVVLYIQVRIRPRTLLTIHALSSREDAVVVSFAMGEN